MSVLAVAIHLCELALAAIILWHVPPLLGMSPNLTRVCQILIVVIFLFAGIQDVLAASSDRQYSLDRRPAPSLSIPDIVKPERR